MSDVDVRDNDAAQASPGEQASLSELVQRLSQQTATLVRQEMRLAQAELKEKGKRAGIGAGLMAGAGVVALAALGAMVAGLILLLGEAVAMWISAFIVTVALGALAGVMALVGKNQVALATPPKPEAAIESVQADVAEIKERARR